MTDLRKTWRFVNEIGTVHKLLLKKNKKTICVSLGHEDLQKIN